MATSLFGSRPLFTPSLADRYRRQQSEASFPSLSSGGDDLRQFQQYVASSAGKKANEETLEQRFNTVLFEKLLGYTIGPDVKQWSFWPKPPRTVTGLKGVPDGIIGNFSSAGSFHPLGIVELKKPTTNLDAPQPSYGGRTPVEQAIEYGISLSSCRWIIVSNMTSLRLYSLSHKDAYHEVSLLVSVENDDWRGQLIEALIFFSFDSLVSGEEDSSISRLLSNNDEIQNDVEKGFYGAYTRIRQDLVKRIELWCKVHRPNATRDHHVQAAQRLLDRLLFIHFCEHHPDRLLPARMVEGLVERARTMPGGSQVKVYSALKELFKDLDKGASTTFWNIPKYNGELFKHHDIIDEMDFTDDMSIVPYNVPIGNERRRILGPWGLGIFDFWRELDRDLLGNIFEKSVADYHDGKISADPRSDFGVFYTSRRIAQFWAVSAIGDQLKENKTISVLLKRAALASKIEERDEIFSTLVAELQSLQIADLACGSGVFLVAALEALLNPLRKVLESRSLGGGLIQHVEASQQAKILASSVYGADYLPAAVELAKLALWLTAARKNEPAADLSSNFFVGDSLGQKALNAFRKRGPFDVVVGNPPWGGKLQNTAQPTRILAEAGLDMTAGDWDTWEIFIALAAQHLKPSGRLAIVVPDTFFSHEKRKIRDYLVRNFQIEKLYLVGPDWFGTEVRMSTVLLQAKKTSPQKNHKIRTLLLAGDVRRRCLSGKLPLPQAEAKFSMDFSQRRAILSDDRQIQVFCSDFDLKLIQKIEQRSTDMGEVCSRSRGEEISADGLVWKCGSCGVYTVPGRKKKGAYSAKQCPKCNLSLTEKSVKKAWIVSDESTNNSVPYVDGRSLTSRYQRPDRRFLKTTLEPMYPNLKPSENYEGKKIFIRQAGVGIVATIVEDSARCPQSIYMYDLNEAGRYAGYTLEFILACLVSRTMNWLVMKRFSETDPAKAFAKLVHEKIASLPVPRLPEDRKVVDRITLKVKKIMKAQNLGGSDDLDIESDLRKLWGITSEEAAYINGCFSLVPLGQAVRDLFPDGPPPYRAPGKN